MAAHEEWLKEGLDAWHAERESIEKAANSAQDKNDTRFVVKFYASLAEFEIGRPRLKELLDEKGWFSPEQVDGSRIRGPSDFGRG